MNLRPWHDHEYFDSQGSVERWHIDFRDGHVYNCRRIAFHNSETKMRAITIRQKSKDLIKIDAFAPEDAHRAAANQQTSQFGAFYSSDRAIEFFMDGRSTRQARPAKWLPPLMPESAPSETWTLFSSGRNRDDMDRLVRPVVP